MQMLKSLSPGTESGLWGQCAVSTSLLGDSWDSLTKAPNLQNLLWTPFLLLRGSQQSSEAKGHPSWSTSPERFSNAECVRLSRASTHTVRKVSFPPWFPGIGKTRFLPTPRLVVPSEPFGLRCLVCKTEMETHFSSMP